MSGRGRPQLAQGRFHREELNGLVDVRLHSRVIGQQLPDLLFAVRSHYPDAKRPIVLHDGPEDRHDSSIGDAFPEG
jgi:hypothetical protein